MSDNTKIEWTDATWNPVRGCTKISDGCKNCYAYAFAERWRGIKGHPFDEVFNKLKSFDTGAKKYMAPFSLKKESSNVYGIIFLSSAWQGIDKFLKICWDMDQQNGEANYFIEDDDKGGILIGMDPEFAPFSKTERFEKDLRAKLVAGDFNNEHELAKFCYDRCMRPMHCSATLKRLKKEGIIEVAFHSPQMNQEPPREISIKNNPQLTVGF